MEWRLAAKRCPFTALARDTGKAPLLSVAAARRPPLAEAALMGSGLAISLGPERAYVAYAQRSGKHRPSFTDSGPYTVFIKLIS